MKRGKNDNHGQELVERFIYSCSHELKSPIASMQGLLEIMRYHPHHSETAACIDLMSICTNRMSTMVHSLEEYMINAKRDVFLEKVKGDDLVHNVLNRFNETLRRQRIKVETIIQQTSTWITDAHRANVVLDNLVSNAVIFQDPLKQDKRIRIRLNVKPSNAMLEVSDNGIGISKDIRKKIFQLFYRGHDQSQGSGLGLFLVQNIASKMNAKVSLKSTENIGTSFKVIAPNYQL